MRSDKELTVILTLWDRVDFTYRWMSYANVSKFPFNILIADGGKDKEISGHLSNYNNYPNIKYQYLRYPYDDSYYQYYSKVVDALSQVKTPFVALADNDDFYFVDGLRKSVEFLLANKEYSSCGGKHVGFSLSSHSETIDNVYGDQVYLNFQNNNSFESDSASDRIMAIFRTPGKASKSSTRLRTSLYYNIQRTYSLKQIFSLIKTHDFNDLFLLELFLNCLTVSSGKVRCDPTYLYIMRQRKTSKSSARLHRQQYGNYFDRMLLDTWSDDFKNFVNITADFVTHCDDISLDNALREVRNGYKIFAKPRIIECFPNSLKNNEVAFRNRFQTLGECYGPKYQFSKNVLTKLFHKLTSQTKVNHSKKVPTTEFNRSMPFYEDIKPIYDFLSSKIHQ